MTWFLAFCLIAFGIILGILLLHLIVFLVFKDMK